MHELQSVATTMGFSALDGLMMGTRCGVARSRRAAALMRAERLDPSSSSAQLLYHESGLLGVSGLSSSPQPLLEAEADNPRARAALELYVRRIVREIGALTAVLGGLDMLAFTAGVGEHSAVLRERICGALEWLGVRTRRRGEPRQCGDDLRSRQPRTRRRRADQRGVDRGQPRGARAARQRAGGARHALA